MANKFLSLGVRRSDLKEYIKDSAKQSSFKYKAEKNATHVIYFPYVTKQDAATGAVVKELKAMSAMVHSWTTADNKFKSTLCTKNHALTGDDGEIITDGTCPFCDRVADAWEIYNKRYETEKVSCGLTGDALEKHMNAFKQQIGNERKVNTPTPYLYVYAIQFNTDTQGNPVLDADGMPTYEQKIIRLSSTKVEAINKQLENNGFEMPGSEIKFSYTDTDNPMLLAKNCTYTVVIPTLGKMITERYPNVVAKINADLAKFEWDGIEKAYPEWEVMPTKTAKVTVDQMFVLWDKYKADLLTNPDAQYCEYTTASNAKAVTNPALAGANIGAMPQMGALPQMGMMPQDAQAQAPVQNPAPVQAQAMPQMGMPILDANGAPTQAQAMPQMGAVPQMGAMPQMGMPILDGNGVADI